MKEILLTEEQARQIAESKEPIELRDAAGTLLVKIDPNANVRLRVLRGSVTRILPADQKESKDGN